jgi:hypothetical protein
MRGARVTGALAVAAALAGATAPAVAIDRKPAARLARPALTSAVSGHAATTVARFPVVSVAKGVHATASLRILHAGHEVARRTVLVAHLHDDVIVTLHWTAPTNGVYELVATMTADGPGVARVSAGTGLATRR